MANEHQEDQFQTQLRDYLSGDLAAGERRAFEATLAQSAAAREEFAFSQKLNFAQQNADVLAIAVMVKALAGTASPPASPPSRAAQLYYWLGGALVLVLLAAGTWWGVSRYQEQKTEAAEISRIITPYLQPLEALLATGDTGEAALKAAMDTYREGNYAAAAPALAAYAGNANDPNAALYAGISYLLAEQAETALPFLTLAAQAAAEPVQDAARFYQTLCLIRLGELEKARTMATQASPQDLYHAQYQDLLNDLGQ